MTEKYKAYYIEWVDSSHSPGWNHAGSYEPDPTLLISTIGYLLLKKPDYIVVVSSYVHDGDQVHTPFQIPRCAITKMRRIKL